MGRHAEYGDVVTDAESPSPDRRHIAIVGAGPAGLMAADILAATGYRITIFEQMPAPARKFLLAGRGGLNLTHSEPLESFLARYAGASDRIRDLVAAFRSAQLVAWANDLGIETFVGSSGRVFPKAMKASPLLRAWLKRLNERGVDLKTRHTWIGFDEQRRPIIRDRDGHTHAIHADATLLALGGASWPKLGSNGAWTETLAASDIAITPLQPSNCGVTVAWTEVMKSRFAGSPLKRIAITLGSSTRRGEAVITASGLEGGVIYALAAEIRDAVTATGQAEISIDLKPDMTVREIAERLRRHRGKATLSNHLRKTLALDAAAVGLLHETGIPSEASDLAARIKAVPIHITGMCGMERAISTAGGIAWTSVDKNAMLTPLPGVFVAGEMLDWDAPTGGYLLQATFASAVAAAAGIQRWLANNQRHGCGEPLTQPENAPPA